MARYDGAVSLRQWRKNRCSTCQCIPCQCTQEQKQEGAFKDAQARYTARTSEQSTSKKGKGKTASAPKSAKPTGRQKRDWMKSYRKSHPTASDADVKAAMKKHFKLGCMSAIVVFTTVGVTGVYELVDWIV